jgi:hypothetical protein
VGQEDPPLEALVKVRIVRDRAGVDRCDECGSWVAPACDGSKQVREHVTGKKHSRKRCDAAVEIGGWRNVGARRGVLDEVVRVLGQMPERDVVRAAQKAGIYDTSGNLTKDYGG